ncbi:MAG: hypothetical protein A2Y07_07865 [Planctomycetes bacterium GWF2_50_10]|nr:MAG: hypothetical protein A2Y07_07865 [Planctomycetes bacterium GWF2_50_10]
MKITQNSCGLGILVSILVLLCICGFADGKAAMSWSLIFGGNGDDWGSAKVDSAGNIYVYGDTDSTNLPVTATAFDRVFNGGRDCFVAKYNSAKTLLWCTYIGGSKTEECDDFYVNADGTSYMLITSDSTDFPSAARTGTTEDVIIIKLDQNGRAILAAKRIGGTNWDDAVAMYVNAAKNEIYICGDTYSTNFPTTTGAYDRVAPTANKAFVIKLDSTFKTIYSTLLGGKGYTYCAGMAGLSDGTVVIGGTTAAASFPTTAGAYDRTLGGLTDGFVTKLNASGTGLVFSTFLGSSDYDNAYGISLAPDGSVYLCGQTSGADFPIIAGAYDSTFAGGAYVDDGDAFLAIISPTGAALTRSTFIGGAAGDELCKNMTRSAQGIFFAGNTYSSNFPVSFDAADPTYNGDGSDSDGVMGLMDLSLGKLLYSSYIGSLNIDSCLLVRTGEVLTVAGQISDVPNFQIRFGSYHGANDIYVAAFTNNAWVQPKISGYVKTSGGTVMAGVVVKTSTGGFTATTNAAGLYTLAVTPGYTGSVLASKSGYSFLPKSVAVTNILVNKTQNFTGYVMPTLSGYVKNSAGKAVANVVVAANSGGTSVKTNTAGYYAVRVPYQWTGKITCSGSNLTFVPASRSFSVLTASKTGQNFTAYSKPAITGRILTSGGTAIAGVVVTADNNGGTATTDSSGNFTLRVPYNWTGKIRPASTVHTFVPAYRAFTAVTAGKTAQNFTGYAKPTISGYVKNANGVALAGVTITGDASGGTTTTNSAGYYALRVPYNWTGKMTPKKTGYTFTPVYKAYSKVIVSKTSQNYVSKP